MTDIYDILSRLGVVRKYLGRDYLAYSIRITLQNENYFLWLSLLVSHQEVLKNGQSMA